MNKLTKEKRNQLIATILVFAAVIAGLYFTLISYQRAALQTLETKTAEKETTRDKTLQTIKNSKQIEADLMVVSNKLQIQEAEMASGDLYSSMYDAILKFKQQYAVDIPQYTSSGVAAEVNLLPKFPYKQAIMNVAGTAYYSDLGKFIADFENKFPSSRILNLELSPASTQRPDEKEKLSFRMDIVSLVKPGGPRP